CARHDGTGYFDVW
nr:immunoglobulin heavy chain junction region [Mus musculus]MBK4189088.1 immunoglobulin heavy chain junction region [Mus musculus]MBK4189089.1 immunoglobulin heavy chain junction region [Mus musculus]MBK4189090.1 immunoglobulin heavy chain junction region [Mus musculus]MBK4189091.1 immunoglobulin heavy chain junction region [Mus musculus]